MQIVGIKGIERQMNRSDTSLPNLGRSILANILQLILGRDVTAALIRFILLTAFIAVHWVVTIVGLRFPGEIPVFWLRNMPQFTYPLLNIASTFLNPEVLLHLLPILAGLIFGMLIAARYLSDLFELEQFSISWRYLIGALYGLSNPKLRVNTGEKAGLDAGNTITRIGGPGIVQANLGFAAVFEDIGGIPRIYGLSTDQVRTPTSSQDGPSSSPQTSYTISGFERLRDVVDLRDRIARVDHIQAETLDGVRVVAQDAQMVFRVYGGDQERSLTNPYPFTEGAIRSIVYAQPVETGQRRNPTDALKDIVRSEIRSFVQRHTLDEFLAMQPYRRLLDRETPSNESETSSDSLKGIQIPRSDLTERFHTPELHERLQEQGLELDWVGVGTWRISGLSEDEGADPTIVKTWRDSQRLVLYRSPEYVRRQANVSSRQRYNNIIREWIRSWDSGDLPETYRCYELLTTIARQLQFMDTRLESTQFDRSELDILRNHIDSLIDPQILGGA